MNYQKVKGTQDLFDLDAFKYRYIESVVTNVISKFNYEEIILPIFENTDVFVRSSGEASDIVSKEMYTFLDKGNRSLTLRPEGTAGVVRSLLENKMYGNNNLKKLFYFGPMFRYERPQAGRFRQFSQFGVEVFGEGSELLDVDVIISAYQIFNRLGIKNIKLKINTIGDFASRNKYTEVLKGYFSKSISALCSDCHNRLNTNPMRILDCKVDHNNAVLINAPKIKDSLNEESLSYFETTLKYLDRFNIKYVVDENLVRGLDYYTDTVFEYIMDSDDELNGLAICAGGKYSDLVKSFGGPDIPGIGYAFGVERIQSIMNKQDLFRDLKTSNKVVIISLDTESKLYSLELANLLRENNITTELDYCNYTMKQQFKLADRLNAEFIIIIGEEELKTNQLTIKNTITKTQVQVEDKKLLDYLKENLK